ncbi:MAG: DUF3299 domain-containing protein, partial [Gammaproteobacteria bacterium]
MTPQTSTNTKQVDHSTHNPKRTRVLSTILRLGTLISTLITTQLAYSDNTSTSLSTPASSPIVLQWIDLLPESDQHALSNRSNTLIDVPPLPDLGALETEQRPQWLELPIIGSKQSVSTYNQSYVELAGYSRPLPTVINGNDSTEKTISFLLVPELGADLTRYLPPPNQTVRVNLRSQARNHSSP